MNYFFKKFFLNVAYFASGFAFKRSCDICTVILKIIRNMRSILTSQILDFLLSIRHTILSHATECNVADILRDFKGEILGTSQLFTSIARGNCMITVFCYQLSLLMAFCNIFYNSSILY